MLVNHFIMGFIKEFKNKCDEAGYIKYPYAKIEYGFDVNEREPELEMNFQIGVAGFDIDTDELGKEVTWYCDTCEISGSIIQDKKYGEVAKLCINKECVCEATEYLEIVIELKKAYKQLWQNIEKEYEHAMADYDIEMQEQRQEAYDDWKESRPYYNMQRGAV